MKNIEIDKSTEIKDVKKFIEEILKLDFLESERIGTGDALSYRIVIKEHGNWVTRFLEMNEIGRVFFDKHQGKFYFGNQDGNLKNVFRIGDWSKIKEFMKILENA